MAMIESMICRNIAMMIRTVVTLRKASVTLSCQIWATQIMACVIIDKSRNNFYYVIVFSTWSAEMTGSAGLVKGTVETLITNKKVRNMAAWIGIEPNAP